MAMADVQGGAEIQLAVLLASLAKMPDLEISVVLLNDGGFASQLKDLGVKVDVILESRHNFLVMVKELADYFKREEIDILHTHKYKDNVLGTLASLPRGIRVRVRTVHGSPEPAGRRPAPRRQGATSVPAASLSQHHCPPLPCSLWWGRKGPFFVSDW